MVRSPHAAEPGLAGVGVGDDPTAVVEAPPPKSHTFVDNHPVLSKPRDYYNNSGQNPIVRAGAATLIGIPAGVLGGESKRQSPSEEPVGQG